MTVVTTQGDGEVCADAGWRPPAVAALVVTALVVAVFWPFLSKQVRMAVEHQADWGHILVIPFIAGYFVYLRRRELVQVGFRTTWLGLVPVVIGIAGYAFTSIGPPAAHHDNLQGGFFGVTLFGLVLLFCGWRAMRWLLFPLVYLVLFSQVISARLMQMITFEMQDIAARGSHLVMLVMGLDVTRAGNTLTIIRSDGSAAPLNIAEACSGMRMLMAFLALGAAMAYTGLPYIWQRIVLVVMAVPTAIVVNILRVVTLGLLALVDAEFAAGDFHSFIGLLWLVPAFFILLGLMWIIRHTVIEEPDESQAAPPPASALACAFDRRATIAFVVASLALVSSAVGFNVAVRQLNVYFRKEPVPLRESLATIAKRLGPWQAVGADGTLDEAVVEELGTDVYLSRQYALDGGAGGPVLHLHVAYYTGLIDAVPHVPDRCMLAGGFDIHEPATNYALSLESSDWQLDPEHVNGRTGQPYPMHTYLHPVTLRPVTVRMPVGDWAIRVTEFQNPQRPRERIFAGYLFIANGAVTPQPDKVRLLAFDLTDRYAYFCKVQLTVHGGEALDAERMVTLSEDFLESFLPELMRCLPDWAEVQRRLEEPSDAEMIDE